MARLKHMAEAPVAPALGRGGGPPARAGGNRGAVPVAAHAGISRRRARGSWVSGFVHRIRKLRPARAAPRRASATEDFELRLREVVAASFVEGTFYLDGEQREAWSLGDTFEAVLFTALRWAQLALA